MHQECAKYIYLKKEKKKSDHKGQARCIMLRFFGCFTLNWNIYLWQKGYNHLNEHETMSRLLWTGVCFCFFGRRLAFVSGKSIRKLSTPSPTEKIIETTDTSIMSWESSKGYLLPEKRCVGKDKSNIDLFARLNWRDNGSISDHAANVAKGRGLGLRFFGTLLWTPWISLPMCSPYIQEWENFGRCILSHDLHVSLLCLSTLEY